ncbi:hypothetical protein NPIL_702191 [Nephila pilipes]|uniref:Uncharacterized protein n=1 Tax=Nephila pilipes TaxID=299642 RepID=A0A8X6PHT9_NEPPI|nr:hypothetical protein NPIL_702191 [Nephila pilipes]
MSLEEFEKSLELIGTYSDNVTSGTEILISHSLTKLSTNGGQTSYVVFKTRFCVVSRANACDSRTRVVQLVIVLCGEAA